MINSFLCSECQRTAGSVAELAKACRKVGYCPALGRNIDDKKTTGSGGASPRFPRPRARAAAARRPEEQPEDRDRAALTLWNDYPKGAFPDSLIADDMDGPPVLLPPTMKAGV